MNVCESLLQLHSFKGFLMTKNVIKIIALIWLKIIWLEPSQINSQK